MVVVSSGHNGNFVGLIFVGSTHSYGTVLKEFCALKSSVVVPKVHSQTEISEPWDQTLLPLLEGVRSGQLRNGIALD